MLGSKRPRDSRVQVALNNANGGNSRYLAVPPILFFFIQAFLPMP